MDANQYQKEAARTLIDKPDFVISDKHIMILWCAIGVAGESGEIAELIKKGILHQHELDDKKLADEIGDCLWYLAGLCTILHLNIGTVMQENIDKLKTRYPNGFNSQDSIKRTDVEKGEYNA